MFMQYLQRGKVKREEEKLKVKVKGNMSNEKCGTSQEIKMELAIQILPSLQSKNTCKTCRAESCVD